MLAGYGLAGAHTEVLCSCPLVVIKTDPDCPAGGKKQHEG